MIFAAPILVVWLTRFIFEDIIEVGRIDVGFLPGTETSASYPLTFIPAQAISSLYNFGFALCAAMVFAVALATYGSVVVWMAALSGWLKAGYLLMLLVAFVLVAFNFSKISLTDDHILSKIRLADDHIPTEISRNPHRQDPLLSSDLRRKRASHPAGLRQRRYRQHGKQSQTGQSRSV
ncbi:hypothetical protein ACOJBM_42030 [Rhizobium beringeri]